MIAVVAFLFNLFLVIINVTVHSYVFVPFNILGLTLSIYALWLKYKKWMGKV